jgi:uncharacterized oxidoreductase
MPVLTADALKRVGIEIFKALGATEEHATVVSELLVKANLVGHDSHGVIRILQYSDEILKGTLVPGATVEVLRETSSSALLDGHWGFGQVICLKAMKMAMEKAKTNAVSVICACNCNHIGRLADYSMMAAQNGMIGIAMVNSTKFVAPYGGAEKILSTGPLSYAFPTGKELPFVLDIATSVVAEGKIRVSLHKNEKVPYGWIVDKNGKSTNNPLDLYEGGAILPFGGEVGYKGFGLGMVVDVLTGILARADPAYYNDKRGNGVFLEVINIESFMPVDQFKCEIDHLIRAIKKSKLMHGFTEIMIPGEPEFRTEQKRLKEGISVPEKTWGEIVERAKTLKIDLKPLCDITK